LRFKLLDAAVANCLGYLAQVGRPKGAIRLKQHIGIPCATVT
jgi:hypothetical protein